MPHRFCAWLFALGLILFAPAAQTAPPSKAHVSKPSPEDVSRWKETATSALVIALQVPGTNVGRDAVQLYLDALKRLDWAEPPPIDLYEQLAAKKEFPELCGIFVQSGFHVCCAWSRARRSPMMASCCR
jgi:hypothetical protein